MEIKFRFLKANEIECRVQQCKEKGCILLLYKDARVDQRMLDEAVGPMNWNRSHKLIGEQLFCSVGIYNEKTSQWVYKEDVGVESNTEKEKGRASDSFKRACFNWGIGRELYTSPFIWINLNADEVSSRSGKFYLKSSVKFNVSKIHTNDEGYIDDLEITDNNGRVRYSMNKFISKPKAPKKFIPSANDNKEASNIKTKEEFMQFVNSRSEWKDSKEFKEYVQPIWNRIK